MHVALHSGVVEVKRMSDGRSIELQTGQHAVVGSSDEPFVPLPQAPRVDAPLVSFPVNKSPVQALAFAPDVKLLVLAQQDGPVTVRDLATNMVRNTFAGSASAASGSLPGSPLDSLSQRRRAAVTRRLIFFDSPPSPEAGTRGSLVELRERGCEEFRFSRTERQRPPSTSSRAVARNSTARCP